MVILIRLAILVSMVVVVFFAMPTNAGTVEAADCSQQEPQACNPRAAEVWRHRPVVDADIVYQAGQETTRHTVKAIQVLGNYLKVVCPSSSSWLPAHSNRRRRHSTWSGRPNLCRRYRHRAPHINCTYTYKFRCPLYLPSHPRSTAQCIQTNGPSKGRGTYLHTVVRPTPLTVIYFYCLHPLATIR